MKHARIADAVFNRPQMIEPNYGRVFVSALARQMPEMNIQHIQMPDGTRLDSQDMAAAVGGYQARDERKVFQQVDGVAVIPIEGTLTHRSGNLNPYSGMTGYDGVSTKIDAAINDDSVRGILLDIDSPGGAVSGCFDLADQIYEARQQKPVWGLVDELCASAGFALGSACTRLVAPRTAQIGSVGVVTMHVDQSQFLADMGVDVTFIHAGKHKVDGNSFNPLPDDVRAAIQADIDDVYDMFVDLVARNRGMSTKSVRDTEARVYGAKNAAGVKFIDQIMPARDVLSAFDSDLRAGRAGASMQTQKVSRMNILGLGRAKASHKADNTAERHEPTLDGGSDKQVAAANAAHDGADRSSMTVESVKRRFGSQEGDPAKLEAARNQTLATIGGRHGAAATMYTLMASSGHDVDLSDGTLNQLCAITGEEPGEVRAAIEALPPADDTEKVAAGTGEQMHAIDPDKELASIDAREKSGIMSAAEAESERAEAKHRLASQYTVKTNGDGSVTGGIGLNTGEPASLDALVELCSKHKCNTLAKPLRDRGVTAEQAEAIMADVDDIRDKAAATFPDDPQAAAALGENFIHAAYVEQKFGGAFASLMVEANARMAGEEVDHHPPETSQAAGQGSINTVDFYKK